jgi:sugar phosphate isomerase/epimerase
MSFRLGLAQGLVPTNPAELTPEVASRIAVLGVTAIVTHFQVPPSELMGSRGKAIAATLESEGLRITQCAGLRPDLVTGERAATERSIDALHDLMRAARILGAEMVLAGCGSHHPSHPYGPSRENHTAATSEHLVSSLRELALRAEDAGIPLALEPHVLTTLDTPEHVRSILDEVDSRWIVVNFDPVNFLGSLEAVYDASAAAQNALETIGPRVAPSAHIKDVVVEPELVLHVAEVPPGRGIIDLAAILETCRALPTGSALVIEHISAADAPDSVRHVSKLAAQAGIELN